jgi:phosphatidylglycerol:prolipoprotein diacylglycerol transferase
LGGNRAYLEDPASILRIWEGGLHIFGGFLFGATALLLYLRKNNLDPWLFLDAAGPAALIGQGIGRIANFINQELYGPPTTLPWGIPIEAAHRLPEFPTSRFPVETTRFHPTFAYELLWNFLTAGLLLWLARRYGKQLKPGTIFAGWLLAAGLGRTWIELFFRPDQPEIGASGISYSAIFAALMALAGAILLMVRYKALDFKFAENWEEDYQLSSDQEVETGESEALDEPVEAVAEPVAPRKSKARTANATAAKGKLVRRKPARRTSKTTKKPARTKKSM